MYRFQTSIHARHPQATEGLTVEVRGLALTTLQLPRDGSLTPLAVSFEEVAALLAPLPRMFIEPDGSFVWTSGGRDPAWQLDGVLYDAAGRLMYVELKGSCPVGQFDQLLAALKRPTGELMFQLIAEGVYLGEAEFRSYARR